MGWVTHNGIFTVFHEFRKVEHRLCDLRDVLVGQSLLEVGDKMLLMHRPQLHPARHKRRIKQLPVGGRGGG